MTINKTQDQSKKVDLTNLPADVSIPFTDINGNIMGSKDVKSRWCHTSIPKKIEPAITEVVPLDVVNSLLEVEGKKLVKGLNHAYEIVSLKPASVIQGPPCAEKSIKEDMVWTTWASTSQYVVSEPTYMGTFKKSEPVYISGKYQFSIEPVKEVASAVESTSKVDPIDKPVPSVAFTQKVSRWADIDNED
jgi:hypothetical protein